MSCSFKESLGHCEDLEGKTLSGGCSSLLREDQLVEGLVATSSEAVMAKLFKLPVSPT